MTIENKYIFLPKEKIPDFIKFLSKSSHPIFKKVGSSINSNAISDRQNEILQQCSLWFMISDTPDAATEGIKVLSKIEELMKEEFENNKGHPGLLNKFIKLIDDIWKRMVD